MPGNEMYQGICLNCNQAYFLLEKSRRQRGLDVIRQISRFVQWRKTLDHLPILADQKLGEVPAGRGDLETDPVKPAKLLGFHRLPG